MSTYIVAFVVCDFEKNADPKSLLSIYSPPEVINDTEYSSKYIKSILWSLEEYLGRTYQFPKLDVIAVDDMVMTSMENWGLITVL